jgi:hypothetical protein
MGRRVKISIVTPTTPARRPFLLELAKCIQTQTYTDRLEWIILDEYKTGEPKPEEPSISSIRNDRRDWQSRIEYHAFSNTVPYSTGRKRNFVNSLTTGDIIVHMDDDDWVAPGRLDDQIDLLESSGKPVVGYHTFLYWHYAEGRGYRYNDPTFRPHAAGTSLCYRKSYWETHKFEDRFVGEDFLFCTKAKCTNELASKDAEQFLVARIHGGNTCVPKFGTRKYPAAPDSDFPREFLLTVGK